MRPQPLRSMLLATLLLAGCQPDPCADGGARPDCLEPTLSADYYIEWSNGYFNTMDSTEDRDVVPPYSERIARWEWPPWLKLTAYTRENIIATDMLLRAYPSTIPERDCRFFEEQPFGRCRVTFYYEDEAHEGRGCPIYEEFTFNDAGDITFIEAWSDLPGLLPMADPQDTWAEGPDVSRLSTRVPGLGNAEGLIDLDSEWMAEAVSQDEDVADLVARARDWFATWSAELDAAGDDLWERGCGW